MRVIRTYTLPSGQKVDMLTADQEKLIRFNKYLGPNLLLIEEDAKAREPHENTLEINTNYDGQVTLIEHKKAPAK